MIAPRNSFVICDGARHNIQYLQHISSFKFKGQLTRKNGQLTQKNRG